MRLLFFIGFLPEEIDKAKCIEDKCFDQTNELKKQGTLSRYGVLAPWINGSCYELGTQGPCPETFKFKVCIFNNFVAFLDNKRN